MIAATILPIAGSGGDPKRAVALASMLALMVGVITIAAGVARLGFIADLLSKPTQIGYMNGLALTILVGQLPKLFGFSVDGDGLIDEARGFVNGVTSRARRWARRWRSARSVSCSSSSCSAVLPKVPGVLVAVVVSIAAASWLNLADHGVSLVGHAARGAAAAHAARTRTATCRCSLGGALGIALVSLTDTISTSSAFAARTGQEVDGNGEMIGIGAANLAAGFFQGFPVSTSGSRTAVAEQAGAKTQVTGLVGAAAILLMLVLVPGLLRNLPQPTLAAVVIAASLSLADIAGTVRLLAPAAHRVPAVDGRLPRRGAARRAARHRRRRRALDPERLPPLLVAVPDHPRPRPRPAPATTTATLHPEAEELPGPCDLPLRRAAVLRQRAHVPRRRSGAWRGPSRGRAGSSSPPSRSPTSTPPPPTCSPTSTRS